MGLKFVRLTIKSEGLASLLYKRGIFTESIPEETRVITVPSMSRLSLNTTLLYARRSVISLATRTTFTFITFIMRMNVGMRKCQFIYDQINEV